MHKLLFLIRYYFLLKLMYSNFPIYYYFLHIIISYLTLFIMCHLLTLDIIIFCNIILSIIIYYNLILIIIIYHELLFVPYNTLCYKYLVITSVNIILYEIKIE